MPVTVRTFASSGEAAAALSVRSRRALSRRRHAGDARAERGRHLDLHRRARERPCADADRRGGTARHDRRRRHLCAHPGRARSRLPARPCPLDRRTGGAQHGHRGRQSVRASPVWRLHRCPARARRDGFRAGRPRQPRRADRGIPAIARAAGRHAGACRSRARSPRVPRRSATARSPASSRRAARSSRSPRICR